MDENLISRRMALAGLAGSCLAQNTSGGKRPRLFLNDARLAELQRLIRSSHAKYWSDVEAMAAKIADQAPPPYRADAGEQLWQRSVGDNIATLAFAWLISRDRKYLAGAAAWAKASCGYPTWGLDGKTGKSMDYGLAYGHQLLGLAMLYDYAGADLDKDAREVIRQTMLMRGATQFKAYAQVKHAYLQNHTWINSTGMLGAAIALSDEEPQTAEWAALVRAILAKTVAMLAPDGSSQEGVGYWEYGLVYLLQLLHVSRDVGDNHFASPWFSRTADFGLYLSLPRNAWTQFSTIVDLADCPRSHWYGPNAQLHALGAQYRDSHAQWMAAEIEKANVQAPSKPWLNLLWFDPSVEPVAPAKLPTLRHFENVGVVSARSGWSGDESLLVFKCGPAIGYRAAREFRDLVSPGDFGHTHPDANHLVFFAHGEWLLRNIGYVQRQTRYHNTLLIDGAGQYDAKTWFDGYAQFSAGREPKLLRAESHAEWDWIAGDATLAYRPESGLTRFIRHVFYLKPDVIVVLDDIEVNTPRQLDLIFHTEQAPAPQPDGSFLALGKGATLRAMLLTPEAATVRAETMTVAARHPEYQRDRSTSVLRVSARGARWRNAMAFSAAAAGGQPTSVALRQQDSLWVISAGSKTLRFDFARASAAVSPSVITIGIAGDSTVAEYGKGTPQRGWGQYLQDSFRDTVRVVNLAKGGRSTKTFRREGLWAQLLSEKPDVVLIQFGHNDSHDPALPESTNAATDYRQNLRDYLAEARAAGVIPILVTPVQRRSAVDTLAPYAAAMRAVAAEEHALLIDLYAASGKLYSELGPEKTAELAAKPNDSTHFNEKGARAMAGLVLKELLEATPRLREEVR